MRLSFVLWCKLGTLSKLTVHAPKKDVLINFITPSLILLSFFHDLSQVFVPSIISTSLPWPTQGPSFYEFFFGLSWFWGRLKSSVWIGIFSTSSFVRVSRQTDEFRQPGDGARTSGPSRQQHHQRVDVGRRVSTARRSLLAGPAHLLFRQCHRLSTARRGLRKDPCELLIAQKL